MTRKLEYVPLVELKRAKRNPKDHDLGALDASLKRFGYVEPVVVDERTGRLVSGHGRLELLAQLEAQKAPPPDGVQVNAAGEWMVPTLRGWSSKDDAEAEAFLLAANRITEVGGWHDDQLAEMLQDLAKAGADSFIGTGYDADDLDRLISDLNAEPGRTSSNGKATGVDLDAVPEASERPWTKVGNLIELGAHRLLVGDSFKTHARLFDAAGVKVVTAVVTDPPYAVYGSSTGVASDIADDKMIRPFFDQLFHVIFNSIRLFSHVYTFCDWRTYPTIYLAGKEAGLSLKNKIVWDKGGSGLGSNWANTYEEIAYFARIPPQKAMKSTNKITGVRMVHKPNILRANRPSGEEREHNAAKPVALLREIIEACTDPGDVVWDPFGGSGSTLIACEQANRRCVMGEMEPKFAQIIVERWERVTGLKHKLIA